MRTEANGQPTTNAHYLTYIGYESLWLPNYSDW